MNLKTPPDTDDNIPSILERINDDVVALTGLVYLQNRELEFMRIYHRLDQMYDDLEIPPDRPRTSYKWIQN